YNIQTTILIHGPPHTGKKFIIDYCAKQHHYHQIQLNCFLLLRDSIDATTTELYRHKKRILDASPCIVVLTHLEAFTESWTDSIETNDMKSILKSFFESLKPTQSPYPIIIIATVHDIDSIDPELRSLFTHTIACRVPDEQDRLMILNNMMVDVEVDINVSVRHVALQTAGLNALDLKHGLVSAGYNTIKRVLGLGFDVDVVAKAGVGISRPDILKSIDQSRSEHSDSIGAPKIPTVYWEDIGGLSHVKDTILETIQLPLIHPELFSSGVKKRSGVLLYGPPGTGKTLVAKAVATTLGLNFFSVKGPELLNMYIGESEANVRKVFQKARDAKPCIIFFDELDSVAPQRGSKGDSGGVMDRIVSQLLSELDGMGSSSDIFVIGATNRPDLLDSSLLRPGRFDKLLFLGVSDTNEQQLQLIQALTRKFKLHSDCDLLALVDKCPFIYSGADFYALCSDTLLKSMTRKISEIQRLVMEWNESGPHLPHPHPTSSVYFLDHVYEGSVEVEIRMQDFEDALEELVPSITPAELERYAKLKSLFEPGNE
ncbi:peroxisome assembly factor 2, partial [Globomyces pollinis-pini]